MRFLPAPAAVDGNDAAGRFLQNREIALVDPLVKSAPGELDAVRLIGAALAPECQRGRKIQKDRRIRQILQSECVDLPNTINAQAALMRLVRVGGI